VFSESSLEKHGNASFQNIWAPSELDDTLSSRQETFADGLHRQDQDGSRNNSLAAICESTHHVKFQKGDVEEINWKLNLTEGNAADMKTGEVS
jgi:hypothetical protein